MVTSTRPKVAVFDPLTWDTPDWTYDVERDLLAKRGVDLVLPESPADQNDAIRDADVVIVCGARGRMEAASMAELRNPIALVCYSIGMNQVDHAAAAAAGIPVTNVPFCVDEVSDHAVMLLLMAERRAYTFTTRTANGDWSYATTPEYTAVHRLRGRTLGIIGTGRIGKEVARKTRVFGYRTLGYDPNVSDPGDPQLEMGSLERLLAESDAIVTCADLNPTSRHTIREETLAQVRPGTILVNIARGGLVEERALATAIRRGQIAIAALDVRDPEPPDPANDPLADIPTDRLILTPHVAGGSVEARETLHTLTADVALNLLTKAGRLAPA